MSKEILEKLAIEINIRYVDRYPSKLDFSYSADVDEKTIRRILKGDQNISIILLNQICIALDTSIGELFQSIEEKKATCPCCEFLEV